MPNYRKNNHCSYCGQAFAADQSWPRTCAGCGQISYLNPLPVSVVLLPVGAGLLAIRRTIEPHRGKLALPGGFINLGESWQEAGARELLEETGTRIDPAEIQDFRVLSAPDGTVLIFGLARRREPADLPAFVENTETSECTVVTDPDKMAFPLHAQAVREFFTSFP